MNFKEIALIRYTMYKNHMSYVISDLKEEEESSSFHTTDCCGINRFHLFNKHGQFVEVVPALDLQEKTSVVEPAVKPKTKTKKEKSK